MRHAQSESNQQEVLGQKESPLSGKGIKQAVERAKEWKSIHFDAIYSSDFVRAMQTAKIVAKGKKVIISKNLAERYWGKLEGMEAEQVNNFRNPYELLSKEDRFDARIVPSMETDREALWRLKEFMGKTAKKHKLVLCVGHANIFKIFLVHIGFANFKNLPSGSFKNAGYAIVQTDGVEYSVVKTSGISL